MFVNFSCSKDKYKNVKTSFYANATTSIARKHQIKILFFVACIILLHHCFSWKGESLFEFPLPHSSYTSIKYK